MSTEKRAVLVLKDGTVIHGKGFGASASRSGELVFNTSMTGYQEALTDPSYGGQILLMTYPLIGNYGINREDSESDSVQVEGFAVRELSGWEEHRNSIKKVDEFLSDCGVPGISNIDTRFIVRHIRNSGVMPAMLACYDADKTMDIKKMLEDLTFNYSSINFVEKVTVKKPKIYGEQNKKTIVLVDYGVKMNIVRELVARGMKVAVVPSYSTAEEIRSHEPAGIVLSNGPGDPSILTDAHKTIVKLQDYPMLGICLGHQLLAHAFGGTTYKLKFGHRGSNHAVLDKSTGKVAITTQNHGFAVDERRIPKDFEISHVNVNDNTVEGLKHVSKPISSVQYHPEACPGPQDSKYIFDKFLKTIQ
jgi:carbamoyl-phosphate synthase small subunit